MAFLLVRFHQTSFMSLPNIKSALAFLKVKFAQLSYGLPNLRHVLALLQVRFLTYESSKSQVRLGLPTSQALFDLP